MSYIPVSSNIKLLLKDLKISFRINRISVIISIEIHLETRLEMHFKINQIRILIRIFVKISKINLILPLSHLSSSSTDSRIANSSYIDFLTSLIRILTAHSSIAISQILDTTLGLSKIRIEGFSYY